MAAWIPYLYCCILVSPIYKVVTQCASSAATIDTSSVYTPHILKYPSSGSYGENLNCSWILQSSSSNEQLLYISVMSLATGDLLNVYDGIDTTGTSLFSSTPSGVSGQSLNVVASSGTAYIRFTSNGVTGTDQRGYTVRHMSAVSDDKGGCSSTTVSVNATDTIQYLTSPNFPKKYPSSSSCSWNINTEDSCGSLVLDFILLDLENCIDKVTVTYDGNPTIDLCPSSDWNSTSDYTTTGTTASITMSSDSSDQYQGFVMSYVRTGCLSTTTGTTTATTDVTTVTTGHAATTATTLATTTVTETATTTNTTTDTGTPATTIDMMASVLSIPAAIGLGIGVCLLVAIVIAIICYVNNKTGAVASNERENGVKNKDTPTEIS